MVIFYIDAAWSFGRAVTADDDALFKAAFRPEDESVCMWVAENRPGVYRIQFEIEAGADDYRDAVDRALAELRGAGTDHAFSGKPVELVAMTADGMARWKEDEPDLTP